MSSCGHPLNTVVSKVSSNGKFHTIFAPLFPAICVTSVLSPMSLLQSGPAAMVKNAVSESCYGKVPDCKTIE